MKNRLHLGLLINPYAGVGGPSAQKGSDAEAIQAAAAEGHLALSAPSRTRTFLQALGPLRQQMTITTVAGAMGEEICREFSLAFELVDHVPTHPSRARDTERAAEAMAAAGVDVLVFVGGDGTARDVCRAVGETQVALGVPAGVKMHSGVYAVNPQAAAEVVRQMAAGELVTVVEQEVRDIDEAAFRAGRVRSRYFGSMRVPGEACYIQQVKQGGQEVEELVLADIAAELDEEMVDDTLYIFGPGSTTQQVLDNLHLSSTLLGVDVYVQREPVALDVDAAELMRLVEAHAGPVALYITAIGGQGHIIGRGNQQLSAPLLRRIGRDQVRVLATRTKLKNLDGRPLLMDSGDARLDAAWSGYIPVMTGYRDSVLYPVGY